MFIGSRKAEIGSNGGTPAMAHHVRNSYSIFALRLPVIAVACAAWLAGGGCAWMPGYTPDVHPKRIERHEETVRQFEIKRDAAQYQAALARWRMGDVNGCRVSLDELLRRSPHQLQARITLIDLLLNQGETAAAHEHVEYALSQAPNDAAVAHAAGLVFDALGDRDLALTQFRRAVELDGKNEVYQLSLAEASGQENVQLTSATEAIAMQVAATDRATDINSTPAQQALAQAALALQANQPAQAAKIARDALSHSPHDAGLYRMLGTAEYRRGDYRAAEAALRQAVSLDAASPLSYFLLSATLGKLGQSDESQRLAEQAARLDPAYSTSR